MVIVIPSLKNNLQIKFTIFSVMATFSFIIGAGT